MGGGDHTSGIIIFRQISHYELITNDLAVDSSLVAKQYPAELLKERRTKSCHIYVCCLVYTTFSLAYNGCHFLPLDPTSTKLFPSCAVRAQSWNRSRLRHVLIISL